MRAHLKRIFARCTKQFIAQNPYDAWTSAPQHAATQHAATRPVAAPMAPPRPPRTRPVVLARRVLPVATKTKKARGSRVVVLHVGLGMGAAFEEINALLRLRPDARNVAVDGVRFRFPGFELFADK